MKIETICYEEDNEKNDKHCYNISVELNTIRFCLAGIVDQLPKMTIVLSDDEKAPFLIIASFVKTIKTTFCIAEGFGMAFIANPDSFGRGFCNVHIVI
jgi:hypothetical protein